MTARIITIGREYGSGGRSIGEQAAKMLGYGFYDKVLIDLAAKKSGFAIDYIRNTEEQVTPNYLFNLAANGYYANSMFINDGLPVRTTSLSCRARSSASWPKRGRASSSGAAPITSCATAPIA